jgi:hypothetical protein
VDSIGDAPLVRLKVLGQTLVIVRSPSAAEVILRKHKFIPKFGPVYAGFHLLVEIHSSGVSPACNMLKSIQFSICNLARLLGTTVLVRT